MVKESLHHMEHIGTVEKQYQYFLTILEPLFELYKHSLLLEYHRTLKTYTTQYKQLQLGHGYTYYNTTDLNFVFFFLSRLLLAVSSIQNSLFYYAQQDFILEVFHYVNSFVWLYPSFHPLVQTSFSQRQGHCNSLFLFF